LATLVLDCSVTMTWFIPDEATAQAKALRDRVTDEGAVVPTLWPFEVGNALLFAVRDRRTTAELRAAAIASLQQLPIEIDDTGLSRVWFETLALADRFRLTLYDACYLELAQRRELPLATLDRELRNAARKLGLALL
jgi:predicted nucleic acid-binding protein